MGCQRHGSPISIHAPRVGSDGHVRPPYKLPHISIHAPRVGSDSTLHDMERRHLYFNPRSPCGERQHRPALSLSLSYFNPRSPCGERRSTVATTGNVSEFQSTLPVWGATLSARTNINSSSLFQSTLPVWGATLVDEGLVGLLEISIHAPRVGSDVRGLAPDDLELLISIHAPRVGSD